MLYHEEALLFFCKLNFTNFLSFVLVIITDNIDLEYADGEKHPA